jgi:hypothetical protein
MVPKALSGAAGRTVSVSIQSERLRRRNYKLVLEGLSGGRGFREIASHHFPVGRWE